MAGVCIYECFNKTDYGYCRNTVCTNKTVIDYLNNKGVNTSFSYGPDSRCYRVPCSTCGGSGTVIVNQISTTIESKVMCPVCNGTGSVMHVETQEEQQYDLCKDNAMCCDDDCKKCAQRIYQAYMEERKSSKKEGDQG